MAANHAAVKSTQSSSTPKASPTSRFTGLSALLPVTGLIILLLAWEVSARIWAKDDALIPPASVVFVTLWEIIKDGSLLDHALASLGRVGAGFILATLIAVPLGLLMGYYRYLDLALRGIVDGLRPIPVAAWVPISIILFGIGEKPAVFLVLLGTMWPILLNTIQGVRLVPKHLLWAAHTMGATAPQIFRRVVLPAALPSILTGLRLGVGAAFTCVIVAELIAVRSGLGYLITEARMLVRSDLVIAGMIAIGVVGFLLDWFVSKVVGRSLKWQTGLVKGGI